MKNTDVYMRARAMRLADTLSRIEMPKNQKWKTKAKGENSYCEQQQSLIPSINKFPEIDVDYLLPWNQDEQIAYDDGSEPAVWPIDIGVAMNFDENNTIRIAAASSINPKVVRGVARRVSRWNLVYYFLEINEHGELIDHGSEYFGRFNKEWVSLLQGGNFVAGCSRSDPVSRAVPLVIGCALRQRYEWSAIFSFPYGLKLRYGCDARGALELFRDRDKPEEGRRSALLHWVRKHWRKTSNPDDAKEIRKHLRGVTKISWRGMDVCIVPSEYEIETSYD